MLIPKIDIKFSVYNPAVIAEIMKPKPEPYGLKVELENGLEYNGSHMQIAHNFFKGLVFLFVQSDNKDEFTVYFKIHPQDFKYLRTFSGNYVAAQAYQYFFQNIFTFITMLE